MQLYIPYIVSLNQGFSSSICRRFWEKVDKIGPMQGREIGRCWKWIGACDKSGRGRIASIGRNGVPALAYRVSWLIHHGEIPSGFDVCHKCDNPNCVNPDHLFVGTRKDNMRDAHSKGRIQKGSSRPLAKLNEADVVEILNAHFFHKSTNQSLADRFNVSHQRISKIVNRRIWRHVIWPPPMPTVLDS